MAEPADVPVPRRTLQAGEQVRIDDIPLKPVPVRLDQQPDRVAGDPEDTFDHRVVVTPDDHHVAPLDGVVLVIPPVKKEYLAGLISRGHRAALYDPDAERAAETKDRKARRAGQPIALDLAPAR
jgi:hypothetical protein